MANLNDRRNADEASTGLECHGIISLVQYAGPFKQWHMGCNERRLIHCAVASFTSAAALGFLVSGVHSDIFGRRLFIIIGSVICCAGFIITATANGPKQFIAGIATIGFGSGNVQIVCFKPKETYHRVVFRFTHHLQSFCSIPELMPNKHRHIGLVFAELFNNACLIVGPIVGRVGSLASQPCMS